MYIDNEPGAEYYSAANDRAQAALVFDTAKIMIENNPKLLKFVEIFKNSIVYNAQGSVYKAISRETGTKHGFNVSAFIYDELHGMKDDGTENLYQVLETATGSRRSPLAISITTAGFDKNSLVTNFMITPKELKAELLKIRSFCRLYMRPNRTTILQARKRGKKQTQD